MAKAGAWNESAFDPRPFLACPAVGALTFLAAPLRLSGTCARCSLSNPVLNVCDDGYQVIISPSGIVRTGLLSFFGPGLRAGLGKEVLRHHCFLLVPDHISLVPDE